ncbi:diguanylate cyclase, partial [Klebsiella pneumoniae]
AQSIAERIRERVEEAPFMLRDEGRTIAVTVSIGVAALMPDDTVPGDILKRADLALYRAKHSGRNRVELQAA